MELTKNLPGVFQNWQAGPDLSFDAPVSFDLTTPQATQASLWKLDLPADLQGASTQLTSAENQLSASATALENVPDRIDTLLQRLDRSKRTGVSFDTASTLDDSLRDADRDLLNWIGASQSAGVSFGLESISSIPAREASQQFQQALKRLWRMLVHLAWVETQLEGQLLARTVVNWSGDMDTLWGLTPAPEQTILHQRSLSMAVSTRLIMLRMFIIVTQSAAKLSVLVATPGGALVALPAAWKFVNQVLSEVERYKELQTQSQE